MAEVAGQRSGSLVGWRVAPGPVLWCTSSLGGFTGFLGFAPTVRTLGPVDTGVPEPIRDQLLAVLREAISNIARHALADSADVELRVEGHEVVLTVTDDGVGLRDDRLESGLRNARRRASALGGALEVSAGEQRGTTFVWRVPLP